MQIMHDSMDGGVRAKQETRAEDQYPAPVPSEYKCLAVFLPGTEDIPGPVGNGAGKDYPWPKKSPAIAGLSFDWDCFPKNNLHNALQ